MWSAKIFGFEFYFIFFNFFLYSFFGWIYESCLVSVQKRTWVNRGFLNGPVIPLYGAGATLIYICLAGIQDNAVLVFAGGMLIASLLEYATSYIMEKLFHAKWWDYSNMKFNFQGRICLEASFFWGFLSILMTEILQPLMNGLIERIPRQGGEIAGYVILVLFAADITVTVAGTVQLDKILANMQKVRMELEEYIESTRLYEAKEEWKAKLEQRGLAELLDSLKENIGERVEQMSIRREDRDDTDKADFLEEVENRIRKFKEKYQSSMKPKHWIQKRLLKAFPSMKSINRESALKDLKDKMLSKKK